MNYTLPVSSKGQFTIPLSLREALGITKGTKLIVTTKNDTIQLKPVKRLPLTSFIGTLSKKPPQNIRYLDKVFKERYEKNTS